MSINLHPLGMKPISILGSGSDGIVVKAMNVATKKIYAVKIVNIAGDGLKLFDREAMNTLKLNGCSHTITTKSYQKLSKDIGVITMEYIQSGDLMDYFLSKSKLGEKEVQKIFKEMCIAISLCHKKNIAHLDVKPENFLYDKSKNTMKLIDFHRSFDWSDENENYNNINNINNNNININSNMIEELNGCTSMKYRPPELLIKNQKNELDKIDVWSLGVCLYGLLFGSFPFQLSGIDDQNLDYNFDFLEKNLNNNRNISHNAKDLIRFILNPNPDERPSIHQVLQHPFLKF